MHTFEAIKKGFSLSGKLMKVVTIFFILNVIMGLISLPLSQPENAGKPGIVAISLMVSLVFFLIFIFLQGGALGLSRDIHKTGVCGMSNFASYGKKYYVRILGLLLIYILIAIAVVLVLALIGSGILALSDGTFTRILVGVIAAVAALSVITVLLFPIYSIVADENGVIAAFKKGTKIGWDNFWQVLGLFLSLILISVLISLVIGLIIGLVTAPLPVKISQVVITIINSAIQSYIPIVMMLALMGYYLGLPKGSESSSSPSL
jgi:hypothetical protein